MNLSDYDYVLPEELIAQTPLKERSASRLLVAGVDTENDGFQDRQFAEIVDYFEAGDLLVFNNTKVLPARLYGKKQSGGKVELLIERVLGERHFLAHIRANKSLKAGAPILINNEPSIEVTGREGRLFECQSCQPILELVDKFGHMPLPPYIQRDDVEEDKSRYQTVYAKHTGAVAAPTAGLHFTHDLLECIEQKGVGLAEVTLHVGAGTFQPVKVDKIEDHVMHKEWLEVDQKVCDKVTACKERGGRVFAVGTTTVRSLETAALQGKLKPYAGDTQLFITPGFYFNVVDVLITNFHLPQSTLLMLVSAFSGFDRIRAAYQHAIGARYRFFSYGDAMLLFKAGDENNATEKS